MDVAKQDRPTQRSLQQRLKALNQATIQLMGVTALDRLCEEAISLGIGKLGFDRLGLYFSNPDDQKMISATYGTDAQGNVRAEFGIARRLLENDWVITPAFLEENRCTVRLNVDLVQPDHDSELHTVGRGWNAAAGLWDGEKLIGYLFADNLLNQRPYTADDGELLAAYGLALGHLCTRLRNEEALRQRQLDYRAVLEAISDIIFFLNKEGLFLDYHLPAGAHLYVEATEIIGKNIQALLPPMLAKQTLQAIATTCATGECVTFEYTLPRGSELQYYEARIIEAGNDVILVLVRNMTDRKFLEDQLIAAHKMESLGRMAGGIAHDFNNLLTVIQGFSSLAERQVEPHQPHLGKALTQIMAASEKGARLTSQLLSFARKQVVAPQLLELNTLLNEMQLLLRQVLKGTIELQLKPTLEPLPIRIARSQLEQILVNLVANADDAMPQGGTLQVSCRRVVLSESAARRTINARAGEYVLLEVTDNGAGIDQTNIRNIFDPFFTTKQAAKHSGLGLAICHGIVQQNGGHIAVQSIPQVATTFQIFLPYMQEQITPQPAPLTLPPGHGQETILLVEDDIDVRAITHELLLSCGYAVLPFASGAEAIRYAEQQPATFDLLITDMMMPQLNGQEVAKAILALRPGLPVLLVSGYVEERPDDLVNLVTVDFLAKPYSAQSLAGRVRACLIAANVKQRAVRSYSEWV